MCGQPGWHVHSIALLRRRPGDDNQDPSTIPSVSRITAPVLSVFLVVLGLWVLKWQTTQSLGGSYFQCIVLDVRRRLILNTSTKGGFRSGLLYRLPYESVLKGALVPVYLSRRLRSINTGTLRAFCIGSYERVSVQFSGGGGARTAPLVPVYQKNR
jgi:hypothetical protein